MNETQHIARLAVTMLLSAVLAVVLTGCADDDIAAVADRPDAAATGDARRVKIVVGEQPWQYAEVNVNVTRAGETMAQLKTNSARHWDFTRTSALDVAALAADAAKTEGAKWTYSEENKWYSNATTIKGTLIANGNEIAMTAGLNFSGTGENAVAVDGFHIRPNQDIQMGGDNQVLTIPGLKKGQTVTIKFASADNAVARTLTPSNLTTPSGFDAAAGTTIQTGKGTVTVDGNVTFTSASGAINIYSITVSACIDEGFGLYSTRLGVVNSHVVWDPDILNWAGISNDFYLMLWPNNIIKYSMRFDADKNIESSKVNYFTVSDAAGIERTNKYVNPEDSPDAGVACSYQGVNFTHGLKMKEGTQITWTSGANGNNKTKLTIVQSNWKTSSGELQQIKFDGKALATSGKTAPTGKNWVCVATAIEGGVEYVIRNVEAGAHSIQRADGQGESGILYVCIDIDFTAYSPYVADGTFADGSTTYGVTARDANSLTFAPHTDNRIDLLYAEDYTDNDGTVHLNFKHALGKLSIGTVTNDYGEPISLKQITLKGTKIIKGTMSLHTGEWTTVTTNDDDIVYNETALLSLFGSLSIPDKGSLVFPSYVNYQQIPGSTITFEYLFENSAGKQLKVTKALPIVQGVNTYINIRVDQNHAVVLE